MGTTLYLRSVPDEVIARLQVLANRTGGSVSATAVAELTHATKRADNAAVLAGLADLQISREQIVDEVERSRAER